MTTEGENTIHQFEALFNYATIGIVVTNENARIINFNTYAEEQFGYTKKEVIQEPIEILLPQPYKTGHVRYRNEFFGDPHPRRMGEGRDLRARRKDGSEFPVEVSLSYYKTEQKTYVIAFVIDITVRKNNELTVLKQKEELERVANEIKQLNADLEQKVADRTKRLSETLLALEESKEELNEALQTEKELSGLKSRFVSMASHEFRTPLSIILSSAYLLEQYNQTDESTKREKHIQRIKTAVNDMQMILEDFLSLGRLDEGLIRASPVELNEEECFAIIKEATQQISFMCKVGQVINDSYLGKGIVLIDKHFLKNIIINLLSNAIKFSPENSSIKVNCKLDNKGFILQIEDNGIGISKEDLLHLFERFFRAKNAVNIQGTGLGLHIVNKYLQLMNGNIDVESELNKGTIFTVHIPA